MGSGKETAGPPECAAHRARVAEFCRRVAQCLQVSGDTQAALVEAALFHSDGPGRIPGTGGISQTAESILLRRRDAPNLSRVIEIFEACDAFDESAEFSLL